MNKERHANWIGGPCDLGKWEARGTYENRGSILNQVQARLLPFAGRIHSGWRIASLTSLISSSGSISSATASAKMVDRVGSC